MISNEIADEDRQQLSTLRYRRAFLTGIVSTGATGVSFLVTVVAVRVGIDLLGTERYGVWLAITAAISLLAFLDLGIDDALTRLIATAVARREARRARNLVSTSFWSVSSISASIGLIFLMINPVVEWGALFNASREMWPDVRITVTVAIGLFLIGLPSGVFLSVRAGVQQGFISSMWIIIGSLITLVGIGTAERVDAGLPLFTFLLGSGPVVGLLGNAISLARRPTFRPTVEAFSSTTARELLRNGRPFVVLQLAVAIAVTSDSLVVARILGPDAVPAYVIPLKVFSLLSIPALMLTTPLWPAYSDAVARGDVGWARRTLLRSLALTLGIGSVASAALVLLAPNLIEIWVGDAVRPSWFLLTGLGVWTVLSISGHALAMFLNGIGRVGIQAASASVMAISNIFLSIVLTHRWGVPGPIYGSIFSYTLFVLIPFLVILPRMTKRLALSSSFAGETGPT